MSASPKRKSQEPLASMEASSKVSNSEPTRILALPPDPEQEICSELQRLQKQRVVVIKSRIMAENRIRAVVATTMGYATNLTEESRREMFREAGKLMEQIYLDMKADKPVTHEYANIIAKSMDGVNSLRELEAPLEKSMCALVRQLPVYSWICQPEQCGFADQSLATVIGECGNLRFYANPAKVWRRMGLAPWRFQEKTLMGATWKSGREGSLPAEEWQRFGYSPRRRSLAYVIGENLMKQNFISRVEGEAKVKTPGPYRLRYIQAKVRVFETHPEWAWKKCEECKGDGTVSGHPRKSHMACPTCGGTGKKCLRAHRHGMLLCSKLLLRNLWLEWNPGLAAEYLGWEEDMRRRGWPENG